MKKRKRILTVLLCGIMLTGCAKTPDTPIVREKGSGSLKNYKEAEVRSEKDGSNENKEKTEENRESAGENALAKRLDVPDKYQSSDKSEDGTFEMTCDADIEVPDVDHVSVYKVRQMPFDEKIIGQITKGIFGENPVYDGKKYFQVTKEQALKKLEELKGYQAEGNLDPYGYIAAWEESGEDFNPDEVYSLQREIDSWEEAYQDAPLQTEKVEVTPAFGLTPEGENPEVYADYFNGAVEMDGNVYAYILKKGAGNHMEVKVSLADESGIKQSQIWTDTFYDQYAESDNDKIPTKEKAEEMAGITREEAVEKADTYIKNLGFHDFAAANVNLSLINGTNERSYTEAAYTVCYTRSVDGFPITWETDYGGAVESMESTTEPWGYEKVSFIINKEGLQSMEILNLYEVEEKQIENVEMLSFPEISQIFQKTMKIKYAELRGEGKQTFDIKDIKLGYTRIYDPGADNTTGLLVPVWDFFGSTEIHTEYEGKIMKYTNGEKDRSYLTVNAVDGTIIDRSLGY